MIYLYIKTHNVTGLKYFGKCKTDPFKYPGSGKYWKRHISKHGNDVSTTIYAEFKEETDMLVETAIKFSIENNIVDSSEWANLIPENGLSGGSFKEHFTQETKHKMSLAKRKLIEERGTDCFSHPHTEETKRKMSEDRRGRRWWNNGEIEMKTHQQPEGFVRGRLPNKVPAGWNKK